MRLFAALTLSLILSSAPAATHAKPSRLFTACEHLLDPPDVRLWVVKKKRRRLILMTSRNVASIRHLPTPVSDLIASVKHMVSTESDRQIETRFIDDLQRRSLAGEDFGWREGLGSRLDGLVRILAQAGVPEQSVSALPPFMVSALLLAGISHTSIKDSRVSADVDHARFLVALSPIVDATEKELETLGREIDFKKSVMEFARKAGATTSSLLTGKETRALIEHFQDFEFIASLLDSARDPRVARFRLDLFDMDQKRLDAKVDEFLALVPAMGTLRETSLARYLAKIDDLLTKQKLSLIHADALTLAGERGLLRRLKTAGYKIEPIDTSRRPLR